MPSPLELIFTADLSGVNRATSEAASLAQSSFASVSRSVEGASESMRKYATEQRQQARTFGFIATELGAITGASSGASKALASVGGVLADLATGGIVGGVLGALGLLASAWRNLSAAEDESAKKSTAALKSMQEEAAKSRLEVEHLAFIKAGHTEREWQVLQKTQEGEKILNDLYARRRNLIGDLNKDGPDKLSAGGIAQTKMELLAVNKEIAKFEANRRDIVVGAQVLDDNDAAEAARKSATAAGKAAGKAWADSFKSAIDDSKIATEIDKAVAGRARYAAEYGRPEMDRSGFGSSTLGQGAAGEAALNAMTARTQTPEDRAQSKAFDKAIADHQKRVEDLRRSYQGFAQDAGAGIGAVIAGHEKLGDVARRIGAELLQLGVKWAVTQILNNSLVAGSKTTAEVGGPWGLALGAVVAAAVAALAGSVVSAEGGGDFSDIPLGRPFSMIGHGGEIMIPAPIASYVRKAAERDAQGRGGEPRVSTTLRVVGRAGTFYDMAVEGGRDLARAMVTLRRQGVL